MRVVQHEAKMKAQEREASLKVESRKGVFSVLAWAIFILCSAAGATGVLFLPSIRSRRRWLSRCARAALLLSCIPFEKKGIQYLSHERRLYVANHTSYLDVVLLTALMPSTVGFVAKKELSTVFALGWFLRRIGTHFVERFRARSSINDLNAIKDAVRSGESVLFFPEGTFTEKDEVLPFRLGAFLIAAETDTPVVPVTISGAREVLPPNQWWIHQASLALKVYAPRRADNWTRGAASELRDEVRGCIEEGLRRAPTRMDNLLILPSSEKNNG